MTENTSDIHTRSAAGLPPELDPDTGEADGVAGPTRHNRWNIGLAVVVTGLLIAGGVVAFGVHADQQATAKWHRSTADLDNQQAELVDEANAANAEVTDLSNAANAAGVAVSGLGQAVDDMDQSQNELADDLDKSAAMHNSGNQSGARAELQGDASAALADFEQKVAAFSQAITDAQAKNQHLQEVHHV